MHSPIYALTSLLKAPVSDSEAELAVALAGARGQLKAVVKLCRLIERRSSSDSDQRRAARLRYAVSGALAVLRNGGRRL